MIISKDNKIPQLYVQEKVKDPLVYVVIMCQGAVWLLTEFDSEKQLAFGWAELFPGSGELGYVSLQEIEELKKKYLVEVKELEEPKPLSQLKKEMHLE
jgi:hypothetical protein